MVDTLQRIAKKKGTPSGVQRAGGAREITDNTGARKPNANRQGKQERY